VQVKDRKRRGKEKERRQESRVVSNTEATSASTPRPCDLYKSALKLLVASAILLMFALCNVTYWCRMGTMCWAQGQKRHTAEGRYDMATPLIDNVSSKQRGKASIRLTSLKSKTRTRSNLEPALILALAKIRPRTEALACQKQAQSSH
jgi:hypothetical protein